MRLLLNLRQLHGRIAGRCSRHLKAADVLAGRPLQRRRICRTLSDCTTAPRNGLVSGCYPLDEFYKARPEASKLADLKRGDRAR